MKQSNVQEQRNAMGKLVAKIHQGEKAIEIEIVIKGCCSRFILPPNTQIQFDPGIPFTK